MISENGWQAEMPGLRKRLLFHVLPPVIMFHVLLTDRGIPDVSRLNDWVGLLSIPQNNSLLVLRSSTKA